MGRVQYQITLALCKLVYHLTKKAVTFSVTAFYRGLYLDLLTKELRLLVKEQVKEHFDS